MTENDQVRVRCSSKQNTLIAEYIRHQHSTLTP